MYPLTLTRSLSKRGHTCFLACRNHSRLAMGAEERGITPYTLPLIMSCDPYSIYKFSRMLRVHAIEVVHLHYSKDIPFACLSVAASRRPVKIFLTKHTGSGFKKDIVHKMLYKRLDQVIAVSNFIKNDLIKNCPIEEEQITVIHNGISPSDYASHLKSPFSIREEFSLRGRVVGMIAQLSVGKGQETFIEAASLVSQKEKDVSFLIVGHPADGEEAFSERLKEKVTQLGMKDRVIFTGYRRDIRNILAAIDLCVSASLDEAFGLGLIESMAMKKPVIAISSGAVPEVVVNGQTGILIDRKDPKRMAEAIIELLNDGERLLKMGEKGYCRAMERFNLDDLILSLEDLYRK